MVQIIYVLFILCVTGCGIKGNPLPPIEVTSQEVRAEPAEATVPTTKKEIKK